MVDPATDGPALTIYDANGRPLAWAGRPSELPRDRVVDGANLFAAHAALGLRLVAVEPIAESATSARRLGTVAAEARLSVPDASRQGETYVVETAYGPVTFRRSFVDRDPAPNGFVIAGPNGGPLLEATIADDAPAAVRAVWLARVDRLALAMVALALVLAATVVVFERRGPRAPSARARATVLAIALVWLAWLAATLAVARDAAAGPAQPVWGRLADAAASPADFAATGLALLVSVMLLVDPARRAILARRGQWHAAGRGFGAAVLGVALQVLAGLVLLGLHVAVFALVQEAERRSTASLLRFSVAPWEALRLARLAGLVLIQAAACWAGVLACRLALARWRGPAGAARWIAPVAWVLPSLALGPALATIADGPAVARGPLVVFALAVAAAAWLTRRGIPWFRHGSQASRLGWLLVALLVPAWLLYPVLVDVVDRVKTRLVEEEYAPQVRRHSEDLQDVLEARAVQIDRVADLPRSSRRPRSRKPRPPTEAAFDGLARDRARGGAPHLRHRAVRRRRRAGQPLRAQLSRDRGRCRCATRATLVRAGRRCRRGAAVRRRRAAHAARRARHLRRRRAGRPAHRRRRRRLRDARLQRAARSSRRRARTSSSSACRAPTARGHVRAATSSSTVFGWGRLPLYTLAQPVVAARPTRSSTTAYKSRDGVLDHAGARRRRRSRLRLERSQRHLRRRLSGR